MPCRWPARCGERFPAAPARKTVLDKISNFSPSR
jgi:hypothetical protein